jgi:hypothetical protein
MGRGKRLTAEDIGSIKCLRDSNREIARRIHRSAKVVNNFVQDIENYGKNYRGGIQTANNSEGKKNYFTRSLLLLLLLEYVYPTERVQLRDRRIAREKKYIQKTLPKDVKRMLTYVIIFAHGI